MTRQSLADQFDGFLSRQAIGTLRGFVIQCVEDIQIRRCILPAEDTEKRKVAHFAQQTDREWFDTA